MLIKDQKQSLTWWMVRSALEVQSLHTHFLSCVSISSQNLFLFQSFYELAFIYTLFISCIVVLFIVTALSLRCSLPFYATALFGFTFLGFYLLRKVPHKYSSIRPTRPLRVSRGAGEEGLTLDRSPAHCRADADRHTTTDT